MHGSDLLDDELKDEADILADDDANDSDQCHDILVVLLRKLRTKRKTKGRFRKID